MKKAISRIFSRNLFYRAMLVLGVVASIAYLIPSFTKDYKGKYYVFNNLPSLSERSYQDLKFKLTNINPTYRYRIESVSEHTNQKDWNDLISQDMKTLERRVELYTADNYDIKAENSNGKAVFYVYTLNNIPGMSEILTRNNSDFKISIPDQTSVTVGDGQTPTTAPKLIDLSLSRSDFGFADIIISQGQQNNYQYDVKMPIGLIGPDKLNIINNNIASNLTVFVGGREYSGSFLTQTQYGVESRARELTVSNITSLEDARALKAFLNTSKFNLGYKLDKTEYIENKKELYKLLSIIALFLAVSILLAVYLLKNLPFKKAVYIFSALIIAFGLTKLFGLEVTDGYLLTMQAITVLTIFNSRWSYYVGLLGIILLIKLSGYLYFIDIEWTQLVLILLLSGVLYLTNNIRKINKRYV